MRGHTLPQCQHPRSDDDDLTYRHVVEDFVRGVKVTIYGFQCQAHGRHGYYRVEETTRKLDLKDTADT
jgi:hypothetical protein